MNYENDLKIDLSRLEENLKEQAGLVMKYGKLWAEKVKERDRAAQNLAVVDSELDTRTKKNWDTIPEAEGIKSTEKSVLSLVLKSKEHKEAFDNLLDINEEVNILSVAKSALEHRKKAMEGEVSLYIGGYWADPKVAKRDMDEITSDERRSNAEEQLNKNPRLKKIKLKHKH